MKTTADFVLAADAQRARLFEVITQRGAAGVEEFALRELECLVNPERGELKSEALSDTRPGSRYGDAYATGPGHGLDDHRNAHYDELDRRFAKEIANMLATIHAPRPTRLVALASPKILGQLRKADAWPDDNFEVQEIVREASQITPSQLRDYLRKEGILS